MGETEKTKRYGTAVRPLVFETCGRLGGEGTKLLRDLVTTAANGQCSPRAVGRWRILLERVLLTAQADTYLRALGSRAAERPAAEHPLRLAESCVHFSDWRCFHCDCHVKVRLAERDRDRDFGCIASCVPSPLCCFCSVALAFHSFLMTAACTNTTSSPGGGRHWLVSASQSGNVRDAACATSSAKTTAGSVEK